MKERLLGWSRCAACWEHVHRHCFGQALGSEVIAFVNLFNLVEFSASPQLMIDIPCEGLDKTVMIEDAKKPTGFALLITATRLTVRNWRYLVCVSVPSGIAVLGLFIAIQRLAAGDISSPPEWAQIAFSFASVFLIFFILVANAIGWHRFLATQNPQASPISMLRNLPYWRYIWRAALLCLPAYAVAIAIGTPVQLIFPPPWGVVDWTNEFFFWVMLHAETYFRDWLAPFLISSTLTLIGFVFPAVALGHQRPLWRTIKSSLSYAPQMVVALVVLEIATFLTVEVAGTRLSYVLFGLEFRASVPLLWGGLVLTNLIFVFSAMVKIAILTTAYLHWYAQQKRPAEADL